MKKERMKYLSGLIFLFLLAKTTYGGTPVWTFNPLTPTKLTISTDEIVEVQYRMTNQSNTSHTLTMKPITGITQAVSSGNCKDPFKLSSKQSCILSLQIQGNLLKGSITNGPIVCQANPNGTPNPNLCFRPSKNDNLNIKLKEGDRSPKGVYVADAASSLSKLWYCPMNAEGGINACIDLTNATPPGFGRLVNISVATFSGINYAYVADEQNNILWKCPLDETGGITGGACTALNNATAPGFFKATSVTFHRFSGTMYGYVADQSDILWQCVMDAAGGIKDGICTALTNATLPGFSAVYNIEFGVFLGVQFAYIADESSRVWQCPMDATGSIIGGVCTTLTNSTPPGFDAIYGVSLANFSGIHYLYASDIDNNGVWRCPLNAAGGGNGDCTLLTNSTPPGFSLPFDIVFANFLGKTYGYVPNETNVLWQCPMDATGNFIGGVCNPLTNSTAPGFSKAEGIGFVFPNN